MAGRPVAAVAAILAVALWADPALTETTPWVEREGAAFRLIAAPPARAGALFLGLDIRLEPGWKFFWRAPGRYGAAPIFDWTGSDNLSDFTVLWPVPRRLPLDEAASVVGYEGRVLLPIQAMRTTARGARAHLKLDYGICRDVCTIDDVELSIMLDAKAHAGADVQRLRRAVAALPARTPILPFAFGPAAIGPDGIRFRIDASEPFGRPELFIDAAAVTGAPRIHRATNGHSLTVSVPMDMPTTAPIDLGGHLTVVLFDHGRAREFRVPIAPH